jgi:hypothetical protein
MSLRNKQLSLITEADLQELVNNHVREVKTIEYKQALPGNSDGERREFLYDVSSFANASGGDLIYGIKEVDGVASEVSGLQIDNIDNEILRMEGIIRTGIEPRIPGLSVHAVILEEKGVAIVIRVPRSFALPHVVKYGGIFKFYARNSGGKYQLDVAELRSLFALSETTAERIRNFRLERLGRIVTGESPLLTNNNPKIVLHIVPIGAFDPAVRFDLSDLAREGGPKPIGSGGWNHRYNLEGLLAYSHDRESVFTYTQAFHHGAIEAVQASYIEADKQEHAIRATAIENAITKHVSQYINTQQAMGVEPPLFIMLSLLGVSGYRLSVSDYVPGDSHPIDRNDLIIPEVMMDEFGLDTARVMKPIFDAIWNAGGYERDPNYDDKGNWINRKH